MDFESLIKGERQCECGGSHSCGIESVTIGGGALGKLKEAVGGGKFVLASDGTCSRLFLPALSAALQTEPEPVILDELTLNQAVDVLAGKAEGADKLIALGAGSICQAVKLAARRAAKPYVVVATAPSTEAYASSLVISDGLRLPLVTVAAPPQHLIMDTSIISDAPRRLFAAGCGMALKRYTELADLRIASIVTGKPYCAPAHDAVLGLLNAVIEDEVPNALKLCRALVGSAVARDVTGESAGGSAVGVMQYLSSHHNLTGMNGLDAGLAAHYVYKLYPYLFAALRVRMNVRPEFDFKRWSGRMQRKLGKLAGEVIALEKKTGKNSPEAVTQRINAIYAAVPALIEALRVTPDLYPFFQTFLNLGGELRYEAMDVSRMEMRDAIRYGREFSEVYGAVDALGDLQKLKEAAEAAVEI